MKYFVWVKNIHGSPEPQIWHDKVTDGNGKAKDTLAIYELALVEQSLSIASLEKLYPYEAKP